MDQTCAKFLQDVLSNKNNREILRRWDRLALPDGWLVAGCLFQTVWNVRSGLPAEAKIKDYDVFYFDPDVVTEEAEQLVQARIDDVLGDLGVVVEAKNQARVHLWYAEHFGHPYPELSCVKDGIDRFLILSTCVGIRPHEQRFEVYAPNGFRALYEGSLVPNPLTDHSLLFERKARSYAARWPWLTISSSALNP